MANLKAKRRHHYVPVTYLNGFPDETRQLVAYPKDRPGSFRSRPDRIAFESYYYSQLTPAGAPDHSTMEDLFSEVETPWPSIVEKLVSRAPLTQGEAGALCSFIALLRVRVPAMRDAIELFDAQTVQATLFTLGTRGELPAPPPGLPDLWNNLEISIDPNRSLQAMPHLLKGISQLFNRIGFEVLHNTSTEDFITSDNPVIYFDPDRPESQIRPYEVTPFGRIEFLMPLTRRLILRGRSELPILRTGAEAQHRSLDDPSEVMRFNRLIAKFAYRLVFAGNGFEAFVADHASQSPVPHLEIVPLASGLGSSIRFVFGSRPEKPKWTGPRG